MDEMYAPEKRLLARKAVGLSIQWNEVPAMDQLATSALSLAEGEKIYQALSESLGSKPGVGVRLAALLKKIIPSNAQGTMRVIVSVTMLRQLFADELGDWGGGGGKGLKKIADPLSTTMRRR